MCVLCVYVCIRICVRVYVPVCVNLCVGVCAHTHVSGSQRSTSSVISQKPTTLFSETGSLRLAGAHPSSYAGKPVSPRYLLGSQACVSIPGFLFEFPGGNWVRVFMVSWQVLYQLGHLPSSLQIILTNSGWLKIKDNS